MNDEKENILNSIKMLLEHLTDLKRSNYAEAELFFTNDFNYLTRTALQRKNMIFNFLEELNNNADEYEVEKIKQLHPTVFLVHLKCFTCSRNRYYASTLIFPEFILLIKKIGTAYYITEAIDFKNNEASPIYAVLKKFS
ncbi:hypothetical protein ACNQO6_14670 [Acinetobacter calcoaceticus]|uniref:hypothetical protein n=1 Tax=Acinetobacter TaxID=469 RepID=UPI002B2B1518|nr:hypothetical protein SB581_11370 [Acinetobacter baumannii]